jgi:hypothetical protein
MRLVEGGVEEEGGEVEVEEEEEEEEVEEVNQ